VWDLETGKESGAQLNAGNTFSIALAGNASRPTLMTAHSGFVRLWDLETRMPLGERLKGDYGRIELFAVGSLAGRETVLFNRSNKSWMMDLETEDIREWKIGNEDLITAVAIAKCKGRSIVLTGNDNGDIRVWEWDSDDGIASDGQITSQWALGTARQDGRSIVVSGGYDGLLRCWDGESGRPLGPPLHAHNGPVWRLVTTKRHRRSIIISQGSDGRRVWDTEARTLLAEHEGEGDIRYTPLAIGLRNRKPVVIQAVGEQNHHILALSDIATGERLAELHRLPNTCYTALATGTCKGRPIVVAAALDNKLFVIDLESGEQILEPLLHREKNVVTALLVAEVEGQSVLASADGDPYAFGERDSTVHIWDLLNGKLVGMPLRAHTASLTVGALTIMRCGSRPIIVSGDSDGLLCLWELDGRLISRLSVGAAVMDFTVTPRNTLVVATGQGLIALRFGER